MAIIVTPITIRDGGQYVYNAQMVIGSTNNKQISFVVDGVEKMNLSPFVTDIQPAISTGDITSDQYRIPEADAAPAQEAISGIASKFVGTDETVLLVYPAKWIKFLNSGDGITYAVPCYTF